MCIYGMKYHTFKSRRCFESRISLILLSYYSRFLTVYCNHIFPKNNYSASFYPNIRYLSNCDFTSFIQHLFILWKWIGLCVIFDLKTFYKYFLRIKPQSSIEKQAIWTCDFDWILNSKSNSTNMLIQEPVHVSSCRDNYKNHYQLFNKIHLFRFTQQYHFNQHLKISL